MSHHYCQLACTHFEILAFAAYIYGKQGCLLPLVSLNQNLGHAPHFKNLDVKIEDNIQDNSALDEGYICEQLLFTYI